MTFIEFTAGFFLAACPAIAQEPPPPPLPVTDAAPQSPAAAPASSLADCVRLAREHSPALKAAAAVAEARQLEKGSAEAAWLPTLDLDTRIGRQGTSSNYLRRSFDAAPGRAAQPGQDRAWRWYDSSGLTLRQLIWDGGRADAEIEAAGLTAVQAQIDKKLNAEDTVLEAVRAHIRLFDARQQCDIQADTLKALQALGEIVRRRVEEKTEEGASLIQVRGRIARSQSSLIGAQAELLSAEADYERVTGVHPGPLTNETGPASSYKSLEDALAAAVNHPAIQARIASVSEGEARLKGRESALKPRIGAELSARARDNDNGTYNNTNEFGAYLTAEWNLYRGGGDVKAIEAGVKLVDAAEAQLVETRRKIFQDLRETWFQLAAAEQQTALALEQELSAEKTFTVYHEQYKASRRSLFDLLNITEELAQSQAATRSSKNRLAFLRYRLKGALAQLAETFPEDAKASSATQTAKP